MDRFCQWEFLSMPEDNTSFFKQLGQQISALRQEAGLTQAQLAEMLNLKQQVIASYEVGRRRLPISLLPALSKALGVSVEDLLGSSGGTLKRGPTPKLQRQVEQITRLPKSKQRFVSELLETVLQQKV
jgi:transcriptional regulator with XRE-family HTH domain